MALSAQRGDCKGYGGGSEHAAEQLRGYNGTLSAQRSN